MDRQIKRSSSKAALTSRAGSLWRRIHSPRADGITPIAQRLESHLFSIAPDCPIDCENSRSSKSATFTIPVGQISVLPALLLPFERIFDFRKGIERGKFLKSSNSA